MSDSEFCCWERCCDACHERIANFYADRTAMNALGASLALAGLAATLHATVFHEVVASFIHHGLDGVSARWDWCDRFALSSLRDRAGIAIPPEVTP